MVCLFFLGYLYKENRYLKNQLNNSTTKYLPIDYDTVYLNKTKIIYKNDLKVDDLKRQVKYLNDKLSRYAIIKDSIINDSNIININTQVNYWANELK